MDCMPLNSPQKYIKAEPPIKYMTKFIARIDFMELSITFSTVSAAFFSASEENGGILELRVFESKSMVSSKTTSLKVSELINNLVSLTLSTSLSTPF